MPNKIKLLYLCTGNSCRSQMAEGWTHHLKSDQIEVFSAGVETHGLNLNAVKVMAEAGVDITKQRSQHIDEFKGMGINIVVTVCSHAHENCPAFPVSSRVVHFGFDDPPKMAKALAEKGASEEEQLDCYRKVRDQIKTFVDTLPKALDEID